MRLFVSHILLSSVSCDVASNHEHFSRPPFPLGHPRNYQEEEEEGLVSDGKMDSLCNIVSIQFLHHDCIRVLAHHIRQTSLIVRKRSDGIMFPNLAYQANNLWPGKCLNIDLMIS
jgi:hypothetical protein